MRTPRTLGVLGAVALSIAACGGDDAGSTASSAATTAPVTTAKVGPDSTTATTTPAPTTTSDDGAGNDNGTGDVPDPCQLLTAQDLAIVFDEPPAPAESVEATPPINLRQCEWKIEPSELTVKIVYLSVVTTAGLKAGGAGGGNYTAKDQFEQTRVLYPEAEDVQGVGDGAFYNDANRGELQALVHGDTMLTITSLTIGADLPKVTPEQLLELMKAAVARL